MASTFSTNLAIELIGTGDQAGTWGVTTNTNLGTLIEQAISGYVTQAVATGTDTTITIPNGATGVARNMYLELTGTGGTNTNLIVPANKKLYFVFNNSTGAVTVKVSGQTGVSVPQGKKVILVSNGTDIVNGLNYIADFGTNSFTVTNLTATSGTITNLIATTASISDVSATVLRASSATLTHLSATSASITNLSLTSLTISSLSITNVSVASATVSSNLTLSGGTANGVLYLNGSKVATSGSALTFDGTNLAVSVAAGNPSLEIKTAGAGNNPVVKLTADTNYWDFVGAFSQANDDLLIRYNGSTLLNLTNTGNLGIGTASPTYKLDVDRGASNGVVARFGRSSGQFAHIYADTASVYFGSDNGANTAWQFNESSDYLAAWTAASERLRIDSSGNLGIGTTSPGQRLQISQSETTAYASSSGSVAEPAGGANISIVNTGSGGFASLRFSSLSGSYAQGYLGFTNAGGSVAGNFVFGQRNNTASYIEQMRLDSSGQLGIGTTSPAVKLDVSGSAGAVAATIRAINTGTTSSDYAIYQLKQGSGSTWQMFTGANSDTLTFGRSGVGDYLYLNNSGNLGLGGTPSAWESNYRVFDIGTNGTVYNYANGTMAVGNNLYVTSGVFKYKISSYAPTLYAQFTGKHAWYTAASGTAGNTITFTQAMTLGGTSVPYLLVGTTTDYSSYSFQTTNQNGLSIHNAADSANIARFAGGGNISLSASGNFAIIDGTDGILFGSAATERARITAGGYFKASNDGTYVGSAGSYHEFRGGLANGYTCIVSSQVASPASQYVFDIRFSAATPNDTNARFWSCTDATAERAYMRSNGGLSNYQANDTNLSDQRVKKDIKPLGSMWDKFKALEIVTFKYKDQTHDDDNIGVIAQQVESVAPEFIDTDGFGETPEGEEPLKTVYTTDMYHAAIKALQEAMARIEQLEAKVAVLENK